MIAETIVPIFLIILVGFVIGRYKKLDVNPMVYILLYITGPALVFTSLIKTEIAFNDFFVLIFSSFFIIFALYLVAVLVFRKEKSVHLPIAFGNHGYLGYPVALFAFGMEGLGKAVVYTFGSTLLMFTFGIYIASHKKNLKEALKIPLIYAFILAVIFNVLKMNIPSLIFKPIESIGEVTIPLALIVLGYQLSSIKFNLIKYGIIGAVLKIGLGFLFGLLFVTIFNVSGITKNIIILQSAMPSAVMSLILYKKFNEKADIVAATVFISYLMAMASIPLILWFL